MGGDENLAWALLRLITAYNYGGESPRTPVPLSRLLKLWDEHPEGFDEQLTHHLFWDLKWVTSSLLSVPEVPLPAIRGYLADMGRRYRTAGHSPRPVHQSRFYLARHIGADAETGEAFDAWLAADRDRLADCDACERREAGPLVHRARSGRRRAGAARPHPGRRVDLRRGAAHIAGRVDAAAGARGRPGSGPRPTICAAIARRAAR